MSIDEWFRQLSSDDEPPNPEEARAIQEFLAGNMLIHTAAERFTAVVATAGNDLDEIGEGLYRIWNLIIDLVQEFPETQDKIVDLLAEIEKLPNLEHHGHTIVYDGMNLWSDLPTFGWVMRDRWNYFDPTPDDPDQAKCRSKWLNINAFAARITAGSCAAEFSLFGLWSLREALEEEPLQDNAWSRWADADPDKILSKLDGSVPTAAQWIFHAGRALFTCEDQIEPSPNRGNPMRGGTLWGGKSGFCRERWGLWKKRFEWVQGVPTLEASTKEVAKEAVEAMEKIEKDA